MSPKLDSSWLDVAVGDNKTFVIRDHGQLGYIISGLPTPKQQKPRLSVFLGDRTKELALQALFPYNNIRRTRATASIGLRIDNLSVETNEPHLFVDGGVGQSIASSCKAQAAARPVIEDHPIAWKAVSAQAAVATIFSRLVFLFADVICIFVDDFPSIQSCAQFLLACAPTRLASSLPVAVRPRVIVVSGNSLDRVSAQVEFNRALHDENGGPFSGINFICVDSSSDVGLRDRLRASIRGQLEDMGEARRHRTLISSTASALLMDHYLPGSMLLEPRAVFGTLYRSIITRGIRDYNDRAKFAIAVGDLVGQVELEFVSQFYSVVSQGRRTADHRRDQLLAMSHELGKVQSAKICLYCLVRTAQHSQACHHALCDQCAQIFGYPAPDVEYQFTVSTCLICLSGGTMVVDVLPPTMNPTILAIDGGGVRGSIPLEYLLLIQESLGPQCKIQDLVDLSIGSSSGRFIHRTKCHF
ncbi:hypothetical protein EYZ11_009303 [Aspergillus tanneri]|uniref:PNPLA domain-containing protein n=1 Tax=Aspergillus tanneri TaxID=1220188 RepID=A0A4S3J872_9EURO|nr:hypothetical protein EYZ11_009303 [Aspergillus tanneri]